MKVNKKGFSVGDLLPLGISIVVLGIALSLGLTLLSDFNSSECSGDGYYYNTSSGGCYTNSTGVVEARSNSFNGTMDATSGLKKFTAYLPTIALVIVVAVIIGIVTRYLFSSK